jgi:hypothetical protein
VSGTDPVAVAKAVIKTYGISDAQKIEEVIQHIKGDKPPESCE